jgi:hypothetical protein
LNLQLKTEFKRVNMSEKLELSNGLSRRTMVKGAAWSVPVLATAIAAPMAAASTLPTWNGRVTGFCSGQYDLSVLRGIVGNTLVGTVQAALGLLGIQPNAQRGFTIAATTPAPIPAGTVYRMTTPPALINLSILQGLLDVSVLGVVQVNSTTFDFTLNSAIAQGSPYTFNLFGAILNVGLAGSVSLQQLGADANAGDNIGTVTSGVGVAVNLGSLGVPFVSGSLAVQLCA